MPGSCLPLLAGSCSPLPVGGRKVATPPLPPSKCKRHGRRSKKWLDPNFAAAAVPSSLSAIFGSGPATAAGSLGVASFAAVSASSGNLVRNCVEFYNLG